MAKEGPLLACPVPDTDIRWPKLGSPKLDGIRATIHNGVALSRKLLPIPNKHIQAAVRMMDINGLDGEFIVGDPCADDVYRKTNSVVMSHDKPIDDLTFYVFDALPSVVDKEPIFEHRLLQARVIAARTSNTPAVVTAALLGGGTFNVKPLVHTLINSLAMLEAFEAKYVDMGYEGMMLRDPRGIYKHGRSTPKEQILVKVKRFEDSEAEILGVVEEMHNANAAGVDELGRTKRSKAKAGLVGKGTMGALKVRDCHSGVEFEIGTGFTAADRKAKWVPGTIVKYKHFPVGVKDKPRHPVFIGMRDRSDM